MKCSKLNIKNKDFERRFTMKVSNIKDIEKFFEVVDSCQGKVELVTGEGDTTYKVIVK